MKGNLEANTDYPLIILEIDGNLSLKGVEGQEIIARSEGQDDLLVEQRENHIYVSSKSDCSVKVPRASEVKVEAVLGNASFKSLEGELVIYRLDGNLQLRSIGSARVDDIKGNLLARRVSGDLEIKAVHGNASIEEVQGDFTVHQAIGGNLNLQELEGNGKAEASGNLSINLDPLPGCAYEFIAGSNLDCWLTEDASVALTILHANKFNINVGAHNISKHGEVPFSVTIGDGDAVMKLSAGGNLVVAGQPEHSRFPDFGVQIDFTTGEIPENLGDEINRQIEAQMEMVERQIDFQIENLSSTLGKIGLSEEAAERIARKAREASSRATARAEEKMQRAQEKIQRKLDAARRKAEQKSRSARRAEQRQERQVTGVGFSPATPAAQEEPVSNEERMIILQMLEEKKISLQEAEQLLSALEGGAEE